MTCFQRVLQEAEAAGELDLFKALILDGTIVIKDGLDETDLAIIESWNQCIVH